MPVLVAQPDLQHHALHSISASQELKAAVTEVTGCMLDEHCLPVWEGALERHDAVDVEEDSAAESLVGLKVALAFALMVEDVVGGIFGMFVPTLFGRSSDYIFAVVNMYGCGQALPSCKAAKACCMLTPEAGSLMHSAQGARLKCTDWTHRITPHEST